MSLSRHGIAIAGTILRHKALGLLPGHTSFQGLPAVDPHEGTDSIPVRPPHFDPAQLDRILACGFRATRENQVAMLSRTGLPERPAQFFRLGPATVLGGQIFAGGNRHFMSDHPVGPSTLFRIEEIGEPVALINSQQGLKYFGHWLRDDCPIYETLLERADGHLLSMRRPDWPDSIVYQRIFGQAWDERLAFRTPDLTLTRDLGFSREKQDRIRDLRARMRRERRAQQPGAIVYIARGSSGTERTITNEAGLLEALTGQGVRILYPENGTERLVDAMLDAALVITVEGSQAAHAVYTLRERGALLILQPPRRFYNAHLNWTQLLDMEYGIVVGEDRGTGFHVRPDEVLAMIDRLLAAGASPGF